MHVDWSKIEEDEIRHFLESVFTEVMRARKLFPSSEGLMVALSEEAGEVAKAMMQEPWEHVYIEAVQCAAMACRLAIEGDPTLENLRDQRVPLYDDDDDEDDEFLR